MPARRYDVIVVGGRVAGAATALLLARQGLRVLVVDRARFPSDTLSTHQVQVPGVARLRRWGLLDALEAAGTPATRRIRFDPGHVVLHGNSPTVDGVDALYSPRRTLLDQILLDAAREAGAEVREGYLVEEIVWSDGRVTGIRGRDRGRDGSRDGGRGPGGGPDRDGGRGPGGGPNRDGVGARSTEPATLVIGADGKHSMVAEAVGARRYRQRPAATMACYTYWSGVPLPGGEMYQRPGRAVAAFPTNDDLTMVYLAAPRTEFETFRSDVEGCYLATLDRCGDLGERVRAGSRAERFRSTTDLPNTFRDPDGPGWALVGDAGLVMDPISAQGIGNALRDAELLAETIGAVGPGARLAGYRQRRDAAARPMYDLTTDLTAFRPTARAARALTAALDGRPAEIDRFLGILAGVTPPKEYLSLRGAYRVLGLGGLARLAFATPAPRHPPAIPTRE